MVRGLIAVLFRVISGICIAASGVASAAPAIPGSFQQIDNYAGGWFTGFAVHPGGRIYGRTDVGGLYRSDDHGNSWRSLSGDFTTASGFFVQGVATAPGNPDIVYQCLGTSYDANGPERGIWKSTDGGTTWTRVKSGLNFSGNDEPRFGGECVALHPAKENEVWAGSRANGLWKSTDAGATWNEIAPATFGSLVITTICIHPNFPDQIWVGGEGGVWVSTNHGSTWVQKQMLPRVWRIVRKPDGTTFINGGNANPSTTTDAKLLRVTATDWANPATYTFTDTWQNWLNAHQAARGWKPAEYNPGLTLLPDGSLLANSIFQTWARSTNNGTTWTLAPLLLTGTQPSWQPVPPPSEYSGGSNQIVPDPSDSTRWFLAAGFGPLRTEDGGAHWSYIVKGVGEMVGWQPRFHPADPSRVYLPLADMGLCVVTDGGASGASNGFILPHFPWPDDNVMFCHRSLVSGSGRILAPGGEQANNQPRIYKSTDDGIHWTKLSFTGIPVANGREIVDAIDSIDNPDDFIVFTGGAITSTDGGVYRTTDGGQTFVRSTGLPSTFNAGDLFWWDVKLERDAVNPSRRYAMLRNQGLFLSNDRGATWSKPAAQPPDNYGLIVGDGAIGDRLWFYNHMGLFRSDNAGSTWSAAVGAFTSVTAADAVDGRLAVLGKRTGDTFDKVYYSSDNGATWGEVSRAGFRFGNAMTVAVDPWRAGTVWISTNGRSFARFTPWTPIEVWRNDYFGLPGNEGIGADQADPDGDGLANLMEYAIGADPNASTPGAASAASLSSTGATYLTLTLQRTAKRPDVSYIPEVSGDLSTWSAGPGSVTILDDSPTLLRVRDNVPMDQAARRFIRVRIEETPAP